MRKKSALIGLIALFTMPLASISFASIGHTQEISPNFNVEQPDAQQPNTEELEEQINIENPDIQQANTEKLDRYLQKLNLDLCNIEPGVLYCFLDMSDEQPTDVQDSNTKQPNEQSNTEELEQQQPNMERPNVQDSNTKQPDEQSNTEESDE
jgi:hypothetical protein